MTQIIDFIEGCFDRKQLRIIKNGIDKGLDISWYSKMKYNDLQMIQIKKGLEYEKLNNIDKGYYVSKYAKNCFNYLQMNILRKGVSKNIDITFYNNEGFCYEQMLEISLGLEYEKNNGMDPGSLVNFYRNNCFDYLQMMIIREGLIYEYSHGIKIGYKVNTYTNPNLNAEKMDRVYQGIKEGLNVKWYAKDKYNIKQIDIIILALKLEKKLGHHEGYYVSWLTRKKFNEDQMREILTGLIELLDVSFYDNPDYDQLQMVELKKALRYENKENLEPGSVINKITNHELHHYTMKMALRGYKEGLNIFQYTKQIFEPEQVKIIYKGLKNKVNVIWLAKKHYSHLQMEEIYQGLLFEKNNNYNQGELVTKYWDFSYNSKQMHEILEGLKNSIEIEHYCSKNIDSTEMKLIRRILELKNKYNLSTSFFLTGRYNPKKNIKYAIKTENERGVRTPSWILALIYRTLKKYKDISWYSLQMDRFPNYNFKSKQEKKLYIKKYTLYFKALSKGIKLTLYISGAFSKFSYWQVRQIYKGLIYEKENAITQGKLVSFYSKSSSTKDSLMKALFQGLIYEFENKLELGSIVGRYSDNIKSWHLEYIIDGLKNGLDVSLYSNENIYKKSQLEVVYKGLCYEKKNGINSRTMVEWFAITYFSYKKMNELFKLLACEYRKNISFGKSINFNRKNRFDAKQIRIIRIGLQSNIDVSIYAHPEYSYKQMSLILAGLKIETRENFDFGAITSWYADPRYNYDQMKLILKGYAFVIELYSDCSNYCISEKLRPARVREEAVRFLRRYAKLNFNYEKMEEIFQSESMYIYNDYHEIHDDYYEEENFKQHIDISNNNSFVFDNYYNDYSEEDEYYKQQSYENSLCSHYSDLGLDEDQIGILVGRILSSGTPQEIIDRYADPNYTSDKLEIIFKCYDELDNPSNFGGAMYTSMIYDKYKIFDNPLFDISQVAAIYNGLLTACDIFKFRHETNQYWFEKDPNDKLLENFFKGVISYAKLEFNSKKMYAILDCIKNEAYNIIEGTQENFLYHKYINESFCDERIYYINLLICQNKDISFFLNPQISIQELRIIYSEEPSSSEQDQYNIFDFLD